MYKNDRREAYMHAKDQIYFSELFEQEIKKLVAFAYRKTHDMALAEDLVGDTFLIAWTQIKKLKKIDSPKAWLYKTLKFKIMNSNRLAENTRTTSFESVEELINSDETVIEEILPSDLSEDAVEIIKMRFEDQASFKEISRHYEISESAARSRVYRIIEVCKKENGKNFKKIRDEMDV
jgi:RNA polymerase sigma-70 factor (ECF subfamily)